MNLEELEHQKENLEEAVRVDNTLLSIHEKYLERDTEDLARVMKKIEEFKKKNP